MTRRAIAASAAVFLAGFHVAPAQTSADQGDKGELLRLEKVWNEAHMAGDAEALAKLWADDLEVAVPKMAVMKKDELVQFVRTGRMKFGRYETSDVTVRV